MYKAVALQIVMAGKSTTTLYMKAPPQTIAHNQSKATCQMKMSALASCILFIATLAFLQMAVGGFRMERGRVRERYDGLDTSPWPVDV